MKVAVLTLTRDRLDYTQHCFARLHEFAGCDFDHYVLDQGSTDGTKEWLDDELMEDRVVGVVSYPENIGISAGMNELLTHIEDVAYDVIVKFDNDCELTQPNTLADVAALTFNGHTLLSPRILGLQNPPAARGEFDISGETILDIPQIGGIFLAAPGWIYRYFRFNEANPVWGGDDVELCRWFRSQNGRCGYVKRLEASHYETTDGQHNRYPDYFQRTRDEGKHIPLAAPK